MRCLLLALFLVLTTHSAGRSQTVPRNSPAAYTRLSGTIAGQPVVMYLMTSGERMCGRYYYEKVGQAIPLLNIEDRPIVYEVPAKLSERDPNAWNDMSITFHRDGTVTGSWGNKQLPIVLREDFPSGSFPLYGLAIGDSIPGADFSPIVKTSLVLPSETANPDAARFLARELGKQIALTFTEELEDVQERKISQLRSGADLEHFARELTETTFREWTTGEEGKAALSDGKERGIGWSHESSIYPIYNANGILVLEIFSSEFTGGAHETFFDSFLILDLTHQKELTWRDFTVSKEAEVSELIEKHFRKDYDLPKPKPLTDLLFTDNIETTTNAYVTDKGIGFVYPPYDIASWATGQIEVFVPFKELKLRSGKP